MYIAGKQVNSFVDYDGNISYVIFTAGCNMNCWYCHNRDILHAKVYLEENEIIEDIRKRVGFLDAIVITGGEPTLQKDLPDFIKKVREFGLKIKIDTNGTNPDVIKALIEEKLIDYVAMDIKTSFINYKKITCVNDDLNKIKQTIEILINSQIEYEFRTTMSPDIDRLDIIDIAKAIKGAKLYVIQQFRHNEYSKKFCDKKPYTKEELEKFAKIAGQHLKNVKIRA